MCILIITKYHDPTADYFIKKLEARQIKFLRINLDEILHYGTFTIHPENMSWEAKVNDTLITSQDVSVVWLRRFPKPSFKSSDGDTTEYANQEWSLFWKWWIDSLDENLILDTEQNINRAANKFLQLKAAMELGLLTPKTIVTNSPSDFVEFLELNGRSIGKTLGGFGKMISENEYGILYTHRITEDEIRYSDSVKLVPLIVQEEVKKSYEIRATLVGEQLFSCKIDSQKSERTRVDWRKYDFPRVTHTPMELPHEIAGKLKDVASHFKVHFASFDLAVTPEGKYIFLEMNPNSQWVWIEALTGLPITDSLIALLLTKQKSQTERR